jgi:hypothetical protein
MSVGAEQEALMAVRGPTTDEAREVSRWRQASRYFKRSMFTLEHLQACCIQGPWLPYHGQRQRMDAVG